MSDWISVRDALPPAGIAVDVLTANNNQRSLIFDRGLWWLPDKSMYVYFAPTHWWSES